MLTALTGRRALRLPDRYRNVELANAHSKNNAANDKLDKAVCCSLQHLTDNAEASRDEDGPATAQSVTEICARKCPNKSTNLK